MNAALRFAKGAAAGHANSMASMRALTHHLVETKHLDSDAVELIREHAIEELAAHTGDPIANEARLLILHEFP
jgi:hypothetical protein